MLLAVVLAVVAVQHNARSSRGSSISSRPPATAPTSAPTVSASSTATRPALPLSSVAVTRLGHRLLIGPAGWDLFGRSPDGIVKIDFASGNITHTTLPPLATADPVSFVPAPGEVIIRPADRVPGYLVPDGQPARTLPPPLANALAVYPGPDPQHVWVQTDSPSLELVGIDGQPTGTSVPYPTGDGVVSADGRGDLLFTGLGGVYRMLPSGLIRVTTGAILAVGQTRWLAAECDDRHRCSTVAIEPDTGVRRVVPIRIPLGFGIGAVSPDGRAAALVLLTSSNSPVLRLLDLQTGVDRVVAVSMSPDADDGALVWSPDSRTLVGIDSDLQLFAVDRDSLRVSSIDTQMLQLLQLASRSSAG